MDVIRLRVNLKHVEPKVMRSLIVPLDIELQDLHITLQTAIGWYNIHLYSFDTQQTVWTEPDKDLMNAGIMETFSIVNVTLRKFLFYTGVKQFTYTYDFGDYWEHTIHVGTIQKAKPGELYPQLVRIKGRCPPENVGGPWGYEEFVSVTADKNHPEFEEYIEWHMGEFNATDSKESYLRKNVETVAQLISEGRPAREYFGYHPPDGIFFDA